MTGKEKINNIWKGVGFKTQTKQTFIEFNRKTWKAQKNNEGKNLNFPVFPPMPYQTLKSLKASLFTLPVMYSLL